MRRISGYGVAAVTVGAGLELVAALVLWAASAGRAPFSLAAVLVLFGAIYPFRVFQACHVRVSDTGLEHVSAVGRRVYPWRNVVECSGDLRTLRIRFRPDSFPLSIRLNLVADGSQLRESILAHVPPGLCRWDFVVGQRPDAPPPCHLARDGWLFALSPLLAAGLGAIAVWNVSDPAVMRVRVSVIFVGVALVAWQCWRSLRVTVEEQGLRQQSAKILWGDVAAWFLEGDTVFFVAKDGTEIRFRLTWFRRSTDIWRYLLAKTPVSPRRYDVLGASLPLEP